MNDCGCPTPTRPRGDEAYQRPPWVCMACGGYACDYAPTGRTRCPETICDCFIATHPDSPHDLHPEAFTASRKPNPDCAARGRVHGRHLLAGPGGCKPGSWCDGKSGGLCPECGEPCPILTGDGDGYAWFRCDRPHADGRTRLWREACES